MDIYVSYKEFYPNLEKALRDGAKIHIFRSGGGLRVVRVEKKGELISYGEHPYLSGALAHAESDFGLSYAEQYGDDGKHLHYLTGEYPKFSDPIDAYISGDNTLDIFYSEKCKSIFCTTPPKSHLKRPDDILWGSSSVLMGAISLCLIHFRFENKKKFMERVG